MKLNKKDNIVLIGMPGSGKSTIGRRLAKLRGMEFIDTDRLLEQHENMPIQAIVNRLGVRHLRRIEGEILSSLELKNHVISTGGSAVYSNAAMQHLGAMGARVYLQISLPTLVARVTNLGSRGLAKMKSHPLPRLYAERVGLYHAAADVLVDNNRPITAVTLHAINQQIDNFYHGTST